MRIDTLKSLNILKSSSCGGPRVVLPYQTGGPSRTSAHPWRGFDDGSSSIVVIEHEG